MIRHKSKGPEQYEIYHDRTLIGTAGKDVGKSEDGKRKETNFVLNCSAPGALSGQTIKAKTMRDLKIACAEKLGVKVDEAAPKAEKPVKADKAEAVAADEAEVSASGTSSETLDLE